MPLGERHHKSSFVMRHVCTYYNDLSHLLYVTSYCTPRGHHSLRCLRKVIRRLMKNVIILVYIRRKVRYWEYR